MPSVAFPSLTGLVAVAVLMPAVGCASQSATPSPSLSPTASRTAASRPAQPDFSVADRAIDEAIATGQIPGAVLLVGRSGGDVYQKAFGSRAVEPSREAMTPDTVFDLASLTKPIATATSVMLLAERGKIAIDGKASAGLSAFAAAGKGDVTVGQLLLHRSGLIADNALSNYAAGPVSAMSKIFAAPTQHPPGTRFVYSDVGYIVLGELVRAVDGRSLDRFAAEEVFGPVGMRDTAFRPPAALRDRIAPTERRDDRWLRGDVHDPRAAALGGVAGHAGLFGTAADVGRFCRMILRGGTADDGRRILQAATVAQMTRPQCFPDGPGRRACRSLGFDVDTDYSTSPRGDRFARGVTFGHTGFTGTMFWIDPANDCYFVLLTSALHPAGKGNTSALRRKVANAVASALLGAEPPLAKTAGPSIAASGASAPIMGKSYDVRTGIDVLAADNFKALAGRRIALLTNQTGLDRQGNRTIDLLAAAPGVKLVKLLSPEHGAQGLLDEKVGDATDQATGLRIHSLYGESRKPAPEMLADVDTIVFDIQDVGARFYTYVSTMALCMEVAADAGKRFVVLDRPNPISGLIVDGPIADEKDLNFTAYAPIPVSHGMTVGELAQMFNRERRIGCDLMVVPMKGWRRSDLWDDMGLAWVNPSPNLRSPTAALLYPGLGLLEMANVSVGRGTATPFEHLGAPWIDEAKLAAALNAAALPGVSFAPTAFTPTASKFAGVACGGVRIRVTDAARVEPVRLGLTIAWHLRNLFGDKFEIEGVNRLLKNAVTFNRLTLAEPADDLPATWRDDLATFARLRQRYLIYR